MSIWQYITDIELKRLKEAKRAVGAGQAELEKLERAQQENTHKMYVAEGAMQKHQTLIVARAVGDSSAPLPPAPESVEEIKLVLSALEQHRRAKRQDVQYAQSRFDALKTATMAACVARAAERYREQAGALAATWTDINTALAASLTPSLSWRHVFIPALEGMQGAMQSYDRPALFTGAQPNSIEMESVLMALLQ